MSILDRIFGRKSLSRLTPSELRKEEILLEKQRDRLLKQIERSAAEKQKIFESGANAKSAELRRALAAEFELKTHAQVLAARELNVRSKELLTVARLRMVQENRRQGRGRGRLNVGAGDVARIAAWIEDDAVSQDQYVQKLDALLEAGAAVDEDAMASGGLSPAGNELLAIWAQMDGGKLKADRAFDQADAAVRRAVDGVERAE